MFPNKTVLQIVIRSNLEYDDDNENYVRDEIFKPNHQTSTQDREDIINRYFPRDSITVTHIPSVTDPKILKNFAKLRESSHWKIFDKLMTKISDLPEKKTFKGSRVDGPALNDLAEKLVKSMNENAWKDFGDLYSTMERDVCRRSYDRHIKPVLMRRSSELEDMMMDCVDKFKKECLLESEIEDAKRDLKMAHKEKRKREEAEEQKRKEEEKKRKQEDNNKWFTYENAKTVLSHIVTSVLTAYLISDEQLKNNVTTLPDSQYNHIGLTGMCWIRKSQRKTLG